MKVMLYTNVVSDIITKNYPKVLENLNEYKEDDLVISSISEAELRYGLTKSSNFKSKPALIAFLNAVEILPFDSKAA